MDRKLKINPLSIGAAVFVLALVGIGFWYWQKKSPAPVSPTQINQKTADISLGSQILTKTQNPVRDKLPETNPFQTETNPLKVKYLNPFQ